MKALITGIVLTIIALGLIHRNHGKWYEYVAAIIIGCFVIIGLLLL